MRKENVITVNIVYRKKQSSNQEDIDFSITNTQHLHVRTDYKIIFSDLDQKSKLACDYLMKRLIISYAAFIQLIHNQDRLGNLKWSLEFIDWDLIKLKQSHEMILISHKEKAKSQPWKKNKLTKKICK